MNDLLLFEITEIQRGYKAILLESMKNIFIKDTLAILDEISVFWQKNKKLVQCALVYLSKPYRTYVFTAATILDLDDYEHYPFLCFGDYHIWDDPIYGYIKMATESRNTTFSSELHEQIHATIKDNIEILDKVNDKIIILPVRMLSGVKKELIHNAASQAFLSIFDTPPKTIEEYFETFNTIDDIVKGLREGIEKMIMLSERDCNSVSLLERFNEYKSNTSLPLPLPSDASDALTFWFTLIGYFTQVFDIILSCSGYQFVPYIRFSISFNYLLVLSENLSNVPSLDSWLFKSVVAHVMHKSFDKERYSKIGLDEFVNTIKSSNFEKRTFTALRERKISLSSLSLNEIIECLSEQLSACFTTGDTIV